LLVWLTPDLRIKKSLLKCNWTIRKRLPRCKMRLKKRLLAFSRRLHARIRKTRYMHKMRCLLINRRSLLLALRLLWKTPIFPSKDRKSGSAGMPRPISYAVFCLKKKKKQHRGQACNRQSRTAMAAKHPTDQLNIDACIGNVVHENAGLG